MSKRLVARDAAGEGGQIDERTRTTIRRRLLAWFECQARTLPWRKNPRDPYAVWVSEIMLQQTRVSTVVPYFEAFMNRFPTVTHLAEAPLDDVLSAWSGLGYYRRARALHAAARQLAERGNKALPETYEHLIELSGIGQYTAAAIASIAFRQPVAVIDGNVLRVLSRLLCDASPVDTERGRKRFRKVAFELIDARHPGEFNEAMMELGATVCTPTSPTCLTCPLREVCQARLQGRVGDLPVTTPRKPSRRVELEAFVLMDGDRVWMCRRQEEGLFGGLWEPPMVEVPADAFRENVEERSNTQGIPIPKKIEHVLTHRVLKVSVVLYRVSGAQDLPVPHGYDTGRWLSKSKRARMGTSTLANKVLERATSGLNRTAT